LVSFPVRRLLRARLLGRGVCSSLGQFFTRALKRCGFVEGNVSLTLHELLHLDFFGDLRLHCPIATFGSFPPRALAHQLRLYLINLLPHPQRRQLGFKFASEFAPLVMAVITTPRLAASLP